MAETIEAYPLTWPPRCTREDLERAWKEYAVKNHPDKPGFDRKAWDIHQAAYEQGKAATAA